ncbi:MAG TPA: ABC transporter permease [Terriglobales bacterium]|nr:ABC transporter permease [Terriglobales bacterium]
MNGLLQDLRYAVRSLSKSPGFTLVTALTLMIGIGSVVAIFSVAYTALLNPLPFPRPERLVTVNEIVPMLADRPIRVTAPDLVDYENESHAFDALGGWTPKTLELSGAHESMRVHAVRATASVFRVLEIAPRLGRTYTDEEDKRGETICVISYGLWQRWFGADPHVIGQTLDLDRVPYKVIGVMPRDFQFPWRGNVDIPEGTNLWLPMSLTPSEREARTDNWDYNAVARMKPGVPIEQASADVNAIAQRIVKERLPAEASGLGFKFSALAAPMAEQVSGRVRPLVLALLGAVGFVLLIACANVANLLLARGAQREREIAVRVALGASRLRIIRQLISETLVLAGLGAIAGSFLAWWSTKALARLAPTRFAVLGEAAFNGPVLLFAVAIALITAMAVGLIPGLAATGSLPFAALKERGTSASGISHRRFRSGLVIAEIALSVVLLVGAGLLIRSFRDLMSSDPGFAPENAVAGFVSLPKNQYTSSTLDRQFQRELLNRLQAIPGAEFAGLGTTLPLDGARTQRAFTPDDYTPPANSHLNIASMPVVSGEYFQAIGATLRRGRFFSRQDSRQAAPVAIVTQAVARQFWPGKDPIGKRIKWGVSESHNPWLTVVGMIANVKQDTLESQDDMQIYVPADQVEISLPTDQPDPAGRVLLWMYVVVRGRGSAESLAGGLRNAVHGIDARLAVADLQSLGKTLEASAAPQRFNMLIMTGFGAIALLLAIIGIYGLISYSVAQRTQEIGIRMALGASAAGVARMVLRGALTLAIAGVIIGAIAAAEIAPLLKSLLFGVKPLDALTFGIVAAGLLIVAVLASYLPARRATKVDPMVALRYE